MNATRMLQALAAGTLLGALSGTAATWTVDVQKPTHAVSPLLWGIFFEDINLSADGGIYPELVRNRSFEDAEKPESWALKQADDGKSEMAIDTSQPLNPLNRRSLRVRLDGAASLINEGYWGMNVVKGETYLVRLAARGTNRFRGPLIVSLENKSGQSYAEDHIEIQSDRWQYYTLKLTATESDPKARLRLGLNGKGTLWLDMVSVLPAKTWKDHGLRPDLCEMLVGMRPAFMRFPGGCWVEGDDLAHMNHWKNTVGDIAHRRPLYNIWGYWATHGLGYHEYLQLSEDLGAEPLFCINVGMSHREVVPLDQMGQWVQDALDAIEYANGPTNSVWGGLRARNGHPESFNMKYLEIGNENGGPAYHERYALMYHAIKARYPAMRLIANEWGGIPKDSPVEIVDEHYYNNPEFFMQQADRYDNYDRKGPKVFVGEYAVTQNCGQGNLRGAVGEAAFMAGMERNSDVVIMASYAPLFVNVNHKRWNPDLINFDSSRAYGLPSYFVQKLFSENRGDVALSMVLDSPKVDAGPKGGAIGVGTWQTQAEYKDIKVTSGGQTLFTADFAQGSPGWKLVNGDWKAENGVLRQNSAEENIRAIAGDKKWTDYTYSLKARKLGGAEGFLILFNVQDENAKSWWNLGGWGNSRHAIEVGGIADNGIAGKIETGRWYDIRVEVQGSNIKCYLDDKLVHDIKTPQRKALYGSATRSTSTGEIILKVANAALEEQATDIQLNGVSKIVGPAKIITLTSEKGTDENSLNEPTKVAPVTSTRDLAGPSFRQAFPGNSVTVLRIKAE